MRKIDTIIIHCAATKPSMDIGRKEIDAWHKEKGFFSLPDKCSIGYHFVIRRDGKVEEGRSVKSIGAHAGPKYNPTSIGICLVGGINEKGAPENNFTEKQWQALDNLVTELTSTYEIRSIIGHNQVAPKACPSFSVPDWLVMRQTKTHP